MTDILTIFLEKHQRDLEHRTYDYLVLDIKKSEELLFIFKLLIKEKEAYLNHVDSCFFMQKTQRFYLQASSEKEKRKEMLASLKGWHHAWRMQTMRNASYKKASKHSLYFEGKNQMLSLLGAVNEAKKNSLKSASIETSSIKTISIEAIENLNHNILSFDLDAYYCL